MSPIESIKKHFVVLIALHMRAISPKLTPPMGGHNGLHRAQRKDSIFGHVKNFYSFWPFYTKSITKSRKNLFGSCAHK